LTPLFCDQETTLICPGVQAPPLVALGVKAGGQHTDIIHVRDPACRRTWIHLLEKEHTAWHFAAFDHTVVCAQWPDLVPLVFQAYREGRVYCSYVAELHIAVAKGQDADVKKMDLARSLSQYDSPLVLDKTDPWRTRYGELLDVPPLLWHPDARRYFELDCEGEEALWHAQQRHALWLENIAPRCWLDFTLALVRCWGTKVDPEQAHRTIVETTKAIEEDKKLLIREKLLVPKPGGWKKETKTAKALCIEAYAKQGREPPKTAKDGVSLDEEACEGSLEPRLVAYSSVARGDTLLSKLGRIYTPARLGLPVQAGYRCLVNTGRTSCFQGSDPKPGMPVTAYGSQMQNPPQAPGVRECFIPREGHCIVSVDFDAFELRTWAQICLWLLGYSDLAQLFQDPSRCPHIEMGARLRSMTAEDVYALKKSKKDEDKKALKEIRGLAKGPNFGLPGGMGADRLVDYCRLNYGVIITREFAVYAIEVWKQWAEAKPYLKLISRMTANGRVSVQQLLPPGKGAGRWRGDVGYCDAANGFFQGLASDAATMAGNVLSEKMYTERSSPLFGCRLLGFVHDEWLAEVPLEGLHERAYEMARVQVSVAQEYCPDVPLTASPSAMMRWSKAAGDPVFRNGVLIPYEWRDAA
jgi:hypothetical protein